MSIRDTEEVQEKANYCGDYCKNVPPLRQKLLVEGLMQGDLEAVDLRP